MTGLFISYAFLVSKLHGISTCGQSSSFDGSNPIVLKNAVTKSKLDVIAQSAHLHPKYIRGK